MLGINDILKNVPIDEIVTNYASIIALLKKQGMSVIVQSTIQCQPIKCGHQKVFDVNLINIKLEEVAQTYSVQFLRLDDLSDENGLDAKYTYDGVHLTSLGYKNWVSEIEGAFSSKH